MFVCVFAGGATPANPNQPLFSKFVPDVEGTFNVQVSVVDNCPGSTPATTSYTVSSTTTNCGLQPVTAGGTTLGVTTGFAVNGVVTAGSTYTTPFLDAARGFGVAYSFSYNMTATIGGAPNSLYASVAPDILPQTPATQPNPYCLTAAPFGSSCGSYTNNPAALSITGGTGTLSYFTLPGLTAGGDISSGATLSFSVAQTPATPVQMGAVGCLSVPTAASLPTSPTAPGISYFGSFGGNDGARTMVLPPVCTTASTVIVIYTLPLVRGVYLRVHPAWRVQVAQPPLYR